MRIVAAGRCADGYLDYHRAADEYRLEVRSMLGLMPLGGVSFVRKRSPRILLNYLREVGVAAVVRKVRSRLAEAGRNDKWLSCGVGLVLEAPADGEFKAGEHVVFVAPAHPPFAERLCLAEPLLASWSPGPGLDADAHLHLRSPASPPPELEKLAGWSRWSGNAIAAAGKALEQAARLIRDADWSNAARIPSQPSPIADTSRGETTDKRILFGYGNYAKTVILPSLPSGMQVTRVHEIDPTQLGPRPAADVNWSTRPEMFDGDRPDAVFIAGFHHTHPGLAAEALRRGAYAVVEKPLVTARDQLGPLVEAVASSQRLFACFHKRFSAFNDKARTDLDVRDGDPIHYHCVVFEEPLPDLHWYRWPSSGSRLVSNGCHWIDHFLFLNGYSTPLKWKAERAGNDIAIVLVELENGAVFTMTLGDQGSSRLGVRDYIELRAGTRTATMTDGTRYRSEDSSRVLRQLRVGRQESYRRMYRSIGEAVLARKQGDSLESVEVGGRLLLDLEDELRGR